MTKRMLMGTMLMAALVCAGCGSTSVQKGSTVGAGAGAAAGAGVGHYLLSAGSGPGALVGLGIGAAGGALAADHYYGDEEEDLAARDAEMAAMNSRLEASHAQAAQLRSELETEAAQRQALLDAHEEMRRKLEEAGAKGSAGAGPQSGIALSGSGNITVDSMPDGGIKITVLSEVLFASGKAKLTSQGTAVLAEAAAIIKRQFPNAEIEVRGHTDNVPIRYSGFKSNWELSCARGLSVLHCLIEQQRFAPERLNVAGFGDTRPVASNDTPSGRRKNRRAEIVVRLQPPQVVARESH